MGGTGRAGLGRLGEWQNRKRAPTNASFELGFMRIKLKGKGLKAWD